MLRKEMEEARRKAWDSLSRYKFQMFGYWASIWVHLNRIGNFREPNPFRNLVEAARGENRPGPDGQQEQRRGRMTQETEYRPEQIAQMAALVAREMTTTTQSKKHGEYLIYQDGKLQIQLDSYVPNLGIRVMRGDDAESVYSAAYHNHRNPERFRPGLWMNHLAKLHEQASEMREQKAADRESREQAERETRFGPIDDSDVFTDGQAGRTS